MVKKNHKQSKQSKQFPTFKALFASGIVLVTVGLLILATSLFLTWRQQKPSAASKPVHQAFKNNTPAPTPSPRLEGTPVRLTIPNVGIDLKVIPGYYYRSSNSWTLSLNDAQWGTMTSPANNKEGLTFIYAHYRKGVFLTLPKVEPGAQAVITTDNGHTFTYTFRESVVTVPTDTSILSYQGKPILVLQTCTGVWFQNRQLFTFDLAKAA